MTRVPSPGSAPSPAASPSDGRDPAAWQSLHLALHSGGADADAFVTEALAPLLDGVTAAPGAGWFFIRHGEGGPHLRIRHRGPGTPAAADLGVELTRLAGGFAALEGPWPQPHGTVTAVPYRPETERYGGPAALPVAEELFQWSTGTAVEALRAVPGRDGRLALALDLAWATAHGLGLDGRAGSGWLRRHAASWRWVTDPEPLPGSAVHTRVNQVFAGQRRRLAARADGLRAALADGGAAPWLAGWAERVAAAHARLDPLVPGTDGAPRSEADPERADRLLWVWASQLHMLFNRLGVTPDEERAVCRLAARALLEPGGADGPSAGGTAGGDGRGFFPSGPGAADLRYLEESKFLIGRPEDGALRELPAPRPPSARRLAAELPLSADPLPDLTLAEAFRLRRSARGPLTGPLAARTLGGLLWSAYARSHDSRRELPDGSVRTSHHRPYPSAGAAYSVRVRLVALGVDGLAPGTYACVPERRSLLPVGPPPALAELKALSSYLSRPAGDPDGVGIDGAPAVLAVHLDLGLLRRRYGLRALRLGLLEAGHLTQALLLTAGAFGVATLPLGGVQDDLAHEVLGLDDLEEPVQYLLPLGLAGA
ncbi:thiopeptide-type bacteriocin biosynthesis protein [Streptomyces sp. NPDC097619]|uniref:thiopeptide-type bacteriocin biosynthesis protein n=1 Tax=Streptomyces sp. NPDC097619 TaxID=3157228 RepID=UPI00332AAB9B